MLIAFVGFFMFCALPLYLVYAVLQGCAFAMAGIIHLRLHSFGNLEFFTRIPMSVKAGLTGDLINFVICVIAFFVIGYAVAYFMIGKFHFATPGRLGNYTDDGAEEEENNSTGKGGSPKEGFPGRTDHRSFRRQGKYCFSRCLHDKTSCNSKRCR